MTAIIILKLDKLPMDSRNINNTTYWLMLGILNNLIVGSEINFFKEKLFFRTEHAEVWHNVLNALK